MNVFAVFGINLNETNVYYSGHLYNKKLIGADILCCFAESSAPINKVKDHIISSGFSSTYTAVAFLPKMDICGRSCLTFVQLRACKTKSVLFCVTKMSAKEGETERVSVCKNTEIPR